MLVTCSEADAAGRNQAHEHCLYQVITVEVESIWHVHDLRRTMTVRPLIKRKLGGRRGWTRSVGLRWLLLITAAQSFIFAACMAFLTIDCLRLQDADGRMSIAGFGSLLSIDSAQYTFPDLKNFRARKVGQNTCHVWLQRGCREVVMLLTCHS